MSNTSLSPEPDHAELLEGILSRSTIDRAFRQALLVHPNEAIYDAFGVRVPQDYRICFLERDSAYDSVVVLPDFFDTDCELTDNDLDTVHGGGDGGDGQW